jgi:adenosylhomocysteine nucleosidase
VQGSERVRRVALLAPMPAELRPLVRRLGLRRGGAGGRDLHGGRFAGSEVVALRTGIGTRAAAGAAEQALDGAEPDLVVVVGIAGGIGASVGIGDVVVPERVIDRASGAEYRPAPLGALGARGALLTSDALLAEPEEVARFERRGVIAVDMETAAVAAVCEARGCPWSVVRAISDRADDGSVDAALLGLVRPDGTPDLRALVRFLLRRPARVRDLVRLARGMRRAADAAACAVAAALEGR